MEFRLRQSCNCLIPWDPSGERPMQGCVHIVDDDASFRTAMERRLKFAGYEAATYASAEHLLDRLPSERVRGCVLLNGRRPGLTGRERQHRSTDIGSTVPTPFLTGHTDIAPQSRAIKAGTDAV